MEAFVMLVGLVLIFVAVTIGLIASNKWDEIQNKLEERRRLAYEQEEKERKEREQKKLEEYRKKDTLPVFPVGLGVRPELFLTIYSSKLNRLMDTPFMRKVKERVMDENPRWTYAMYENYLFELKRFFLMNTIIKSVPMFSRNVDIIWHEMIIHTREYEEFCKDFVGAKIHHAPNLNQGKFGQSEERAIYDLFYSLIFEMGPQTENIYGKFFRKKLSEKCINEFATFSDKELSDKYFQNNALSKRTIMVIISQLRELATTTISKATPYVKNEKKDIPVLPSVPRTARSSSKVDVERDYLVPAMLFYSVLSMSNNTFCDHMDEVIHGDIFPYITNFASSTGSSGITHPDTLSSPSTHGSSHTSCSSCSSSSCSSTSSCSSSCGGGCGS